MADPSAAPWSHCWQVLDQMGSPDAVPNVQLFEDILSRKDGLTKPCYPRPSTDSPWTQGGKHKGSAASRSNALASRVSNMNAPGMRPVPLAGALHCRVRAANSSAAAPRAVTTAWQSHGPRHVDARVQRGGAQQQLRTPGRRGEGPHTSYQTQDPPQRQRSELEVHNQQQWAQQQQQHQRQQQQQQGHAIEPWEGSSKAVSASASQETALGQAEGTRASLPWGGGDHAVGSTSRGHAEVPKLDLGHIDTELGPDGGHAESAVQQEALGTGVGHALSAAPRAAQRPALGLHVETSACSSPDVYQAPFSPTQPATAHGRASPLNSTLSGEASRSRMRSGDSVSNLQQGNGDENAPCSASPLQDSARRARFPADVRDRPKSALATPVSARRSLSARSQGDSPAATPRVQNSARQSPQPEARYREIVDRACRRAPSRSSQPADRAGSARLVLGSWGLKQSAAMQQQAAKLAGVTEGLERPKTLHDGPGLDEHDQAVQGLGVALRLLQEFAMGTIVRSRFTGHLQEAEEILQQLNEEAPPEDAALRLQQHSALRELLRPLPRQPLEFPASTAWDYLVAAQSRMGGVDDLDAIVRRMRGKVEVLLDKGGALGAVPAAGPTSLQTMMSSRGTPRAGPSNASALPLPSMPSSPAIRIVTPPSASDAWTHPRSPSASAGSPPPTLSRFSVGGAFQPADGGSPPLGREHSARKSIAELSAEASQPQSPAPAPLAASAGATGASGGGSRNEELWQWLENLMLEAQSSDSSRLQWEPGESEEVSPDLHAFNPYTSAGPKHEAAVDRLVSLVKSLQENQQLSEAEAMERIKQQQADAVLRRNIMQAAAVSSLDPGYMQRVLYLLVHLATSVGAGAVRGADAGFLLMAGMGLLLRELQWLMSLLQLTQGPSSPHLQALHAVLKAYETQSLYAAKLKARADELQASMEDAVERVETAERHAEATIMAQREQSTAMEEVVRRNEELEQELRQLRARIARGERTSTL